MEMYNTLRDFGLLGAAALAAGSGGLLLRLGVNAWKNRDEFYENKRRQTGGFREVYFGEGYAPTGPGDTRVRRGLAVVETNERGPDGQRILRWQPTCSLSEDSLAYLGRGI
ncbi:MAG: hypothetical protein WCK90_05260 [archaeon]